MSGALANLVRLPNLHEWLFGVPICHLALTMLFRGLNLWPAPSAGEGGHIGQTRTSDMLAYILTSTACVLYLAFAGVVGMFAPEEIYVLEKDPFYAYSEFFVQHVALGQLAYQTWNFASCLALADLRKVEMLVHHALTAAIAVLCLHPFLHGFGFFFFGVVELTNLPLNMVEMLMLFQHAPVFKKKFTGVFFICKATFALSFIMIRLVAWPVLAWPYWSGSVELLQSGRAHSDAVVVFCLAAHVFVTGLQVFWGFRILAIATRELCTAKKPAPEVVDTDASGSAASLSDAPSKRRGGKAAKQS